MNFIRKLFHKKHSWVFVGLHTIPYNNYLGCAIVWEYKKCRRCGRIEQEKK